MLLGLGEIINSVVGLFAVFWHHSLLHVLALLFSPLFLCCLLFFLTSLFAFLFSSPASVLVYFCCFCFPLWSHNYRTSFVIQSWILFLCLPRTSSAVDSSTSFILFAGCLHPWQFLQNLSIWPRQGPVRPIDCSLVSPRTFPQACIESGRSIFSLLFLLLAVWWLFSLHCDTYHPSLESYSGVRGLLLVRASTDSACCFFAVYRSCPFSGLRGGLAASISYPIKKEQRPKKKKKYIKIDK